MRDTSADGDWWVVGIARQIPPITIPVVLIVVAEVLCDWLTSFVGSMQKVMSHWCHTPNMVSLVTLRASNCLHWL